MEDDFSPKGSKNDCNEAPDTGYPRPDLLATTARGGDREQGNSSKTSPGQSESQSALADGEGHKEPLAVEQHASQSHRVRARPMPEPSVTTAMRTVGEENQYFLNAEAPATTQLLQEQAPDETAQVTERHDPSDVGAETWTSPETMADTEKTLLTLGGDLDDIDAILDPVMYFDELDKVRLEISRAHDLRSLFLVPVKDGTSNTSPISKHSQIIGAMRRVLESMDRLQKERLLGPCIFLFVQDASNSRIIRTVRVYVADVQALYSSFRFLRDGSTKSFDGVKDDQVAAQDGITSEAEWLAGRTKLLTTLQKFGHLPGVSANLDVGNLAQLCQIIALAVAAQVGCHCTDFTRDVWPGDHHTLQRFCVGSVQFARRRLACMHDFLRGPLWAFGTSDSTEAARLLVEIDILAQLWGPIYVVPSANGSNDLLAIHTQGGIMYRTGPRESHKTQSEKHVTLHWVKTEGPLEDVRGSDKGQIKMRSLYNEALPTGLRPFSAEAQLLIGNPSSAGAQTVDSDAQTNADHDLSITLTVEKGLGVNDRCNFKLSDFVKGHTFQVRPLGVRKAVYAPEAYQASIVAGQYVNVGVQKVWKLRHGVSYKEVLCDYLCKSRPAADRLRKILGLWLGVEISACTGNA